MHSALNIFFSGAGQWRGQERLLESASPVCSSVHSLCSIPRADVPLKWIAERSAKKGPTWHLLIVERLPYFFVSPGRVFKAGRTSTSPPVHNAIDDSASSITGVGLMRNCNFPPLHRHHKIFHHPRGRLLKPGLA